VGCGISLGDYRNNLAAKLQKLIQLALSLRAILLLSILLNVPLGGGAFLQILKIILKKWLI
jgi:hypothetical protein